MSPLIEPLGTAGRIRGDTTVESVESVSFEGADGVDVGKTGSHWFRNVAPGRSGFLSSEGRGVFESQYTVPVRRLS